MFEISKESQASRARLGRIRTPHGDIETPSYVIVGTRGAVRCLEPEDLLETKTQVVIANTYHLWQVLGEGALHDYPGLHSEMGWQGPIMTDSGGFQVFSLGASKEHATGKISKGVEEERSVRESSVRVTNAGVYFTVDGSEEYLDAELSMRIQEALGADIIFAFDEPSSPHHDYEYTKLAMERTHEWAKRSIDAKESKQFLYGITQGGAFEDLRKESAQFIGNLPFDGFGIGGAFGSSYGDTTQNMISELDWTIPFLPRNKPRHLLGIGKIEDLFTGVSAGVDTFDCVIPTREARHGRLWTSRGYFDITRGIFKDDKEPIDELCACPVCLGEPTPREELHRLFKEKNPRAGKLATIHNVFFFNDLMEQIRNSIREERFELFKEEYLGNLKRNGTKES